MPIDKDVVVKELESIKKLMILALANSGMPLTQIALALELDRTTVSRMFPKGTFSNAKVGGKHGD